VKLTTARYFTPSGKSIQATGIIPDVLLQPEKRAGDDDLPASLTDYSEATLPGHLRGDEEGTEGYKAGDVLPGDGPINDALAELKQPGSVLARQKAEAAKKPAAKPSAAAVKPVEAKPADTKPAEQPAAAPATPAPAKPEAPASTAPIKP
jgi:carboxyl-terminal processing protease